MTPFMGWEQLPPENRSSYFLFQSHPEKNVPYIVFCCLALRKMTLSTLLAQCLSLIIKAGTEGDNLPVRLTVEYSHLIRSNSNN